MKNLLPVFLLLLLAFAGCKKETVTPAKPKADTVATNGPFVPTPTPVQSNPNLTITGIAPTSGLPNTVVTITGTNFGTSVSNILVYFSNVKATVQAVTPTEIKVLVPVTTTGAIAVTVGGNQHTSGPAFTYIQPELVAPYVSGNVTLNTQADINTFAEINKGKQLQITGNLTIGNTSQTNDITNVAGLSIISSVSGLIVLDRITLPEVSFLNTITSAGGFSAWNCELTSLSFNRLTSFSGPFSLSGLNNLSRVNISLSQVVGNISISACPLLSDLSFLNNIISAGTISINSGARSVTMDNLSTASIIRISGNNLTTISFKSLAKLTDQSALVPASITISSCPVLSGLDFSSVTTISGKISVTATGLADMSGFASLESAGSILINSNPALSSLHGLEHLTRLTSAAINNPIIGNGSSNPISRVNGVYIADNPKLTSLSGLQNITTIPVAYISGNTTLNDFCPFKTSINTLTKLPGFTYSYTNQSDMQYIVSMPALTLTKNGNYNTTQSALDVVAFCK